MSALNELEEAGNPFVKYFRTVCMTRDVKEDLVTFLGNVRPGKTDLFRDLDSRAKDLADVIDALPGCTEYQQPVDYAVPSLDNVVAAWLGRDPWRGEGIEKPGLKTE